MSWWMIQGKNTLNGGESGESSWMITYMKTYLKCSPLLKEAMRHLDPLNGKAHFQQLKEVLAFLKEPTGARGTHFLGLL